MLTWASSSWQLQSSWAPSMVVLNSKSECSIPATPLQAAGIPRANLGRPRKSCLPHSIGQESHSPMGDVAKNVQAPLICHRPYYHPSETTPFLQVCTEGFSTMFRPRLPWVQGKPMWWFYQGDIAETCRSSGKGFQIKQRQAWGSSSPSPAMNAGLCLALQQSSCDHEKGQKFKSHWPLHYEVYFWQCEGKFFCLDHSAFAFLLWQPSAYCRSGANDFQLPFLWSMHQWHPQAGMAGEACTTYACLCSTSSWEAKKCCIPVGVSPPNPHQAQHHASERKERICFGLFVI